MKSTAKKPTPKKTTKTLAKLAKKPTTVARKGSSLSVVRRTPKMGLVPSEEPGYKTSKEGILVPVSMKTIVTPSKFRSGMKSAQTAIKESISEFTQFMTQDMEVFEIELSVSFNAEGKFLGFGVGGATTVNIKIRPRE